MAETETVSLGNAGGDSGGESGGGGSVGSIISAITAAADTSSDNMTQAVMYGDQQKAQRKAVAEDNRRYRLESERADEELELKKRGVTSSMADSILARQAGKYQLDKTRENDKAMKKFAVAAMQGMALGLSGKFQNSMLGAGPARVLPQSTPQQQPLTTQAITQPLPQTLAA